MVDVALGVAHPDVDQFSLVFRHGRNRLRVKLRHVPRTQPACHGLEAALVIPAPHRLRLAGRHLGRVRPYAEPSPVVGIERDRHILISKRQHEQAVDHLIGMQALAVDDQRLRRRGDDRLQLVRERAAVRRIWLLQLVKDDDLRL